MHSCRRAEVKLHKCCGPCQFFTGSFGVMCGEFSSLNWACHSLHNACRKAGFGSTACVIWVCCSIHWWITQNITSFEWGPDTRRIFSSTRLIFYASLSFEPLWPKRSNYFWSILVTQVRCKELNRRILMTILYLKSSLGFQWVLLERLNVWSWDIKCPCKSKLPVFKLALSDPLKHKSLHLIVYSS